MGPSSSSIGFLDFHHSLPLPASESHILLLIHEVSNPTLALPTTEIHLGPHVKASSMHSKMPTCYKGFPTKTKMMAHDFQAHCQPTTFSASRIIAKSFFTVSHPVWIITELQWRAEKYMQKRVFIPELHLSCWQQSSKTSSNRQLKEYLYQTWNSSLAFYLLPLNIMLQIGEKSSKISGS
jgi:hypothetical protein